MQSASDTGDSDNPLVITPNYNSNIFSIIIFSVSLGAALLPKRMSKSRAFMSYIPIMTVFSTGIQLSSVIDIMMHMNTPSGSHEHDMLPNFAAGLCFLLLLGIDSIFLHGSKEGKSKTEKDATGNAGLNNNVVVKDGIPAFETNQSSLSVHKGCENHVDHEEDESHHHHETSAHSHGACESIGTCNTSVISKSKTKMQAMTAILAISIHSFFEGFAVTNDLIRKFAFIFGLVSHKFVESFSIGNSLNNSIFSNSAKLILILSYSLLTPLAIVLRNSHFIAPFLKDYNTKWFDAMCLGSLFFVVFYEAIGHTFHGGIHMKRKMAAIVIGYLIGCLTIFMAHGHSHDHHH